MAMTREQAQQRRHAYTDTFARGDDPLAKLGLPARTGQTGRLQPPPPPPSGRPLSFDEPAPTRAPATRLLPAAPRHTGSLADRLDDAIERGSQGLATMATDTAHAVAVPVLEAMRKPLAALQRVITWSGTFMPGQADASPTPAAVQPPRREPGPTAPTSLGFVRLHRQGIRFLTVRNQPLMHADQMASPGAARILMARAVMEIQGSAAYADDLPAPTSGPYARQAIAEVMAVVDRRELLRFLAYVEAHPQPYRARSRKLVDAFATWIHKGAPN